MQNAKVKSRTSYHYDSIGELIETVDPLGRVTQYQYDQDGNRRATGRTKQRRRLGAAALGG